MASAQVSDQESLSLEKHLTCSICLDPFVDPVTTTCGHSYCRKCLECNFQYNDTVCPLCKQHLSKTPDVSIILRTIVEHMKKKAKAELNATPALAPGDVVCDVCTERKLKAEKSCLVCLTSYCPTHLEKHHTSKRLKGHKLVGPVQDLDQRACLKHGRPLELYSRKTQTCMCVLCMEDGQEGMVSTEDEWDNKKAELENTKTELREEIRKRETRLDEINTSLQSCKEQLDNEWQDIEDVFTAVLAIMEDAHAAALKPINDRRDVVEKEAKSLEDKLKAEIDRLEKTIAELDGISALEDHILFLQSYPSLEDLDDFKDSTEIELDVSLSFGTVRKTTSAMVEHIQQKLEELTSIELKRVPTFTVDVELDASSAHRRLLLSSDRKEVTDYGEDQEVDEDTERFDHYVSVLALNGLTSGRSFWEVEVGQKTGWDVGVARRSANRKGKLSLNPENGYWVAVHYEGEKYAAMTAPPVRLSLKGKPEKVGVYVDYEEGLVSFYDMTTRSHIYSFTECSLQDEIVPYFSPHVKLDEKNAQPLVISAAKHKEGLDVETEEGSEVETKEGSEVKMCEGSGIKMREGSEIKMREGLEVETEEGSEFEMYLA